MKALSITMSYIVNKYISQKGKEHSGFRLKIPCKFKASTKKLIKHDLYRLAGFDLILKKYKNLAEAVIFLNKCKLHGTFLHSTQAIHVSPAKPCKRPDRAWSS